MANRATPVAQKRSLSRSTSEGLPLLLPARSMPDAVTGRRWSWVGHTCVLMGVVTCVLMGEGGGGEGHCCTRAVS